VNGGAASDKFFDLTGRGFRHTHTTQSAGMIEPTHRLAGAGYFGVSTRLVPPSFAANHLS
jgi:hypothetical protein